MKRFAKALCLAAVLAAPAAAWANHDDGYWRGRDEWRHRHHHRHYDRWGPRYGYYYQPPVQQYYYPPPPPPPPPVVYQPYPVYPAQPGVRFDFRF